MNLDLTTIFKVFKDRALSFHHYYITSLNLARFQNEKQTRLKYNLEKVNHEDLRAIAEDIKYVDPDSRRQLIGRFVFFQKGFKNCYALKTKRDEITCLQWIIYPYENNLIEEYYPREYYKLQDNQVMIEKVFTFPKFRGLGFMPAITTELLNMAKHQGYKIAVGYIRKDVISSLNEFLRLGFRIKKIVREYKFLGYTKRRL